MQGAKFDKIGAWAARSAILNPEAAIKSARNAGINHLDIMVNDATSNKQFHLFTDEKTLRSSLQKIKDSGITLTVTTWVVPSDNWNNGIRDILVPILVDLDIEELCLDVEEPFLIPLKKKNSDEIKKWVDSLKSSILPKYRGRVAVTHIVYTVLAILELFFDWCDVIIPQSYATVGNTKNLKPGDLERLSYKKYEKYNRKIVLGVAAWNIQGAYGLNEKDALKASLNAILDLDVYQCRIWSLKFVDKSIADVLKEFI